MRRFTTFLVFLFAFTLFLLAIFLSPARLVQATDPEQHDQSNTTHNYSDCAWVTWYGQTFTAGITGYLTRVRIDKWYNGSHLVQIRTTQQNSGAWYPTTTVIATGTLPASNGYLDVYVTPQPPVVSGTVYAFLVQNPGGCQYGLSNDYYPRGTMTTSADGVNFALDSTKDMTFDTYVFNPRVVTTTVNVHDTNHAVITSTIAGATVHAQTSMSDNNGITPTGTISFTRYAGNSCGGAGTAAGSANLVNGTAESPISQGPLSAGSYSFNAYYGGDGSHDPDTSACQAFKVMYGLFLPHINRQ